VPVVTALVARRTLQAQYRCRNGFLRITRRLGATQRQLWARAHLQAVECRRNNLKDC
jgi:hypothetical protein